MQQHQRFNKLLGTRNSWLSTFSRSLDEKALVSSTCSSLPTNRVTGVNIHATSISILTITPACNSAVEEGRRGPRDTVIRGSISCSKEPSHKKPVRRTSIYPGT